MFPMWAGCCGFPNPVLTVWISWILRRQSKATKTGYVEILINTGEGDLGLYDDRALANGRRLLGCDSYGAPPSVGS
eukprot:2205485-Amphidinium_carterae.1